MTRTLFRESRQAWVLGALIAALGAGAAMPAAAGACGLDPCFAGASADGSRVFFETDEQLVPTDTDSSRDIYERSGGVATLISAGAINGNGAFGARFVGASGNGSIVFFISEEPLAPTDTDAEQDVYQRSGGMTTQVSQGAINGNGAEFAEFAGASADGSVVFFTSDEQLASTDTDSQTDIYRRSGGSTTQVSQGAINGNGPSFASFLGASSDGSAVFFSSGEQLAATDTDSVTDVYQRSSGVTTQVSQGAINGNGAFPATFRGASADGSVVSFSSGELLAATDSDSVADVYQRSGGVTTQVSQGAINGNGAFPAQFGGASSDGSTVVFTSDEPLVLEDTDASADVYLRSGGVTTRVSRGPLVGDGNAEIPATVDAVSNDGARVIFETEESLASTDTDASADIYVFSGNVVTQVSQGAINGNGEIPALFRGISDDGSVVFFTTAEALEGTDGDSTVDTYQRTGVVTAQVSQGAINGDQFPPAVYSGSSGDGARVFFTSDEQLASTDTDSQTDVYQRAGGVTTQVSVGDFPETTIDSGPAGRIRDRTPTYAFSSNIPGSTFECRIDSEPFGSCSGPGATHTPAGDLADGAHSFAVRATGLPTHTDPTPATRSFTVDTKAPGTSIKSGPKPTIRKRRGKAKVTFRFSSTEQGSTFKCKIDKNPFVSCTSPKTYRIGFGKHTFSVRATDAAGNLDTSPATRTVRVKRKH